MFSELIDKFNTFSSQHQVFIASLAAFCIVVATWGFEHLMDRYFFSKRPIGYVIAFFGGIFFLWVIKHYIMHLG